MHLEPLDAGETPVSSAVRGNPAAWVGQLVRRAVALPTTMNPVMDTSTLTVM